MFGRQGTIWQVTVAIVGLAIVAVVLVGPRMRERSMMIASPTAIVGANTTDRVSTGPAADQAPAADPAAPAPADPPASNPEPAQRGAVKPGAGVSGAVSGGVRATTGAPPSVPSVASVATTATQTLFADDFQSDPLTTAVPTGWRLLDAVSNATGGSGGGLLGGLPIVGGGATQSVTGLLPTLLSDGAGANVLGRTPGSWSHLAVNASGGNDWADYSAIADVKPMSGGGFVGVGGRFLNVDNFVSCGIVNGQGLELLQVINGQQHVIASKPLSVVPNVFHTVQMTMRGGQLSCAMDGQPLLSGTTSTLTSGPLGLVALGNLASEFDNVRAIALT